MPINHTYNNQEPYAVLMTGRADEPSSHRAIAVYSKEEYEAYRKKGWKTSKEFTLMSTRAMESPKGYWT